VLCAALSCGLCFRLQIVVGIMRQINNLYWSGLRLGDVKGMLRMRGDFLFFALFFCFCFQLADAG